MKPPMSTSFPSPNSMISDTPPRRTRPTRSFAKVSMGSMTTSTPRILEPEAHLRILDTGDAQRYPQGRARLARQDVHCVRAGDGDDHVRLADLGLLQHLLGSTVALDDQGVETGLQLGDPRRVGFHENDILAFDGQALGEVATHLAGAHDDDAHGGASGRRAS